MPEPARYRIFVALSLPDAVKAEVGKAQCELHCALERTRATWTRREQFHLTLRFLGDVETARAEALIGAVRSACSSIPALRLRAEGIGCFPDLRMPRVVWVGLKDADGALGRLQRVVETACAAFTAQAPEKRFSGHVTLCRIKSLARPEAAGLAGQVEAMAAGSSAGEAAVLARPSP